MKKILLVLAVVLLHLNVAQAQWKQTKTGQTSLLWELSVIDNNVIWAMDQTHSSISYTLNAGVSWTTRALPTEMVSNLPGNLCAVNATTAYLIITSGTIKGIYKTTDNGLNWTLQTTGFTAASIFPDFVYFWNENDGVAVGDAGTDGKFEIYYTSNGGTQWNLVPVATLPASDASDAAFNSGQSFRVHGNTIYAKTSAGKILKSTDKGVNWTLIQTPVKNMTFSFDFKDANNGVVLCSNAGLSLCYSTTDGGVTWTQNAAAPFYGSVKYFPAGNVYIVLNANLGLIYSADNGQTWASHPSFVNVGTGDFQYSATNRLFVGGWANLFFTDNFSTENIAIKSSKIVGNNAVDVTYTQEPDLTSVRDTSNYSLTGIHYKVISKLKISSITQDAIDKNLIHLSMESNLPQDTVKMYVKNIYAKNNTADNQMLYSEPGVYSLFVNFNSAKTVNLASPGTLLSALSANDRRLVSKLTITGTIDARDFRMMRDSLPGVNELDLSGATIAAYQGTDGTYAAGTSYTYDANSTPVRAFYNVGTSKGKTGLTSVILPENLSIIGRSSFYYCSGLKTVTIPGSLTKIDISAFAYCYGLTSISLPAALTSIGNTAFANCSKLTKIYSYKTTPVDLSTSTNVFQGINPANCTLYVPRGSKAAYQAAVQWKDLTSIEEFSLTNVQTVDQAEIMVYPNPVVNEFRLKGMTGEITVNLFDTSGRLVFSENVTADKAVSVKSLPNGIYVLKAISVNATIEMKFVKN